jgi:hypothetical protein
MMVSDVCKNRAQNSGKKKAALSQGGLNTVRWCKLGREFQRHGGHYA